MQVTFTVIPPNTVVYDKSTGLFPFSARKTLDLRLINALKRGIEASGFWNPVIVRANTFEGIAGNHRFIAFLEYLTEKGVDPAQRSLPVITIDCDENYASVIALAESEVRAGVSDWEYINQIIDLNQVHPEAVEQIFNVDAEVIEKYKEWIQKRYISQNAESQYDLRKRLDREWINIINEYLRHNPRTRGKFIELLSNYEWVKSHNVVSLKAEILNELLKNGNGFLYGGNWNSTPTSFCLRGKFSWTEVEKQLVSGDQGALLLENHTLSGCCPLLQLDCHENNEFVPSANSTSFRYISPTEAGKFPHNTVKDGKVYGFTRKKLFLIRPFCVDENWNRPNSCFHQRELEEAKRVRDEKLSKGEYVILSSDINARKKQGEFVWFQPHQNKRTLCSLEYCIATNGKEACGYRDALYQNGKRSNHIFCINEQCGGWHRAAYQAALAGDATEISEQPEKLAERVAFKVLQSEAISLHNTKVLEQVEGIVLPDWDTDTLYLLAKVWKAITLEQIGEETPGKEGEKSQPENVFEERYPWFPKDFRRKMDATTFLAIRDQIRGIVTGLEQGHTKWIVLIALLVKCSQFAFSQKTAQDTDDFVQKFKKEILEEHSET